VILLDIVSKGAFLRSSPVATATMRLHRTLVIPRGAGSASRLHKFVEVDVITQMKTEMKRPWKCGASTIVRRRPRGTVSCWLGTFAIVQQLEHHVVELYEADVQSLLPATQVRNSDCCGFIFGSIASISSFNVL